MKKLLAILGAVGLTAAGSSSVIACNSSANDVDENLSQSFLEQYDAENSGTDFNTYGLKQGTSENTYDFDKTTTNFTTISQKITPNTGAPIQKVYENTTGNVPTTVDELMVTLTYENQTGLVAENGKVNIKLTLNLYKAVKDPNSTREDTLIWEDQNKQMTTQLAVKVEDDSQDINISTADPLTLDEITVPVSDTTISEADVTAIQNGFIAEVVNQLVKQSAFTAIKAENLTISNINPALAADTDLSALVTTAATYTFDVTGKTGYSGTITGISCNLKISV